VDELAAQAAAAEANPDIGVHGVSVSAVAKYPAPSASWDEVTAHFPVIKTGRSPTHWTVVLPKPVGKEDADRFNRIFRRRVGRP
jgi:hypothetical protein